MRRADKRDCYQCPITKEPTGVPVSTSKQDSLNRKPVGGKHATGQEEEGLHIGEPRSSAANKDRPKEPVHFGARTKCDPPVSGTCHPSGPSYKTSIFFVFLEA